METYPIVEEAKLKSFFENGHIPGVIDAATVQKLQSELKVSIESLLYSFQQHAKKNARPPISNYFVGVSGLAKSGKIYLGHNIEFLGCPLNYSVHGEQCLISRLANHDEEGMEIICISPFPCGHCRQFMKELCNNRDLKLLIDCQGQQTSYQLNDLLPNGFGPDDLGISDRLLKEKRERIPCTLEPEQDHRGWSDEHINQTLAFASKGYAPYSKSHAAVSIKLKSGNIVSGTYIESAAYNPSLPPIESAVADLTAEGHNYEEITDVLLVEKRNAPVSHKTQTKQVQKSIAPNATYTVLYFH